MRFDSRLLELAAPVRGWLLVSVLCGLLATLATIGFAFQLSAVIDASFLGGQELPLLWPQLGSLLLFIVVRAVAMRLRDAFSAAASGEVRWRLRQRLLAAVERRGPVWAGGERSGELATSLGEGVDQLDAYFSQFLPAAALAVLAPLLILLYVLPVDLLTALVFALTAPFIPLFMVLIGRLADHLAKKQYQSLTLLGAHFLDSLQGLYTLQLFGRSRQQEARVESAARLFGETTMQVLRVAFLSALALELLATISTAVVAVEVGLRLLYNTIPFEQALFVLILAPEFYLPLRNLGSSFHAGMSGVVAADRLFELLDETGDAASAASAIRLPRQAEAIFPIRFEAVSYTYPGRQAAALRELSFELCEGENLAVAGPSGAGKSTLVALLLRFIEAQGGSITVAGRPLAEWERSAWLAGVSWVPQTPYLINGTLAENLRLARADASDEQLLTALRAAGLADWLAEQPERLRLRLGEQGSRLSGGQAQRLAIARAFLKDAPLLFLDEPTASLDPETARQLQQALGELRRGRTVITVAHRLESLRAADRVLVLREGRLAQAGSHAQLLHAPGPYADLWRRVSWQP